MVGIIGKIGDYFFRFGDRETKLDTIKKTLLFKYDKKQRIQEHPSVQATGKWDEVLEFSAELVFKSNRKLVPLEEIAKRKKPVRMTLKSGESFKVVILEIKSDRSLFVREGYFTVQKVNIKLQRYFGS